MEDSSSLNLFCHEDQYINDEDDQHKHNLIIQSCCDLEYQDDYIKNLIIKELNFESNYNNTPSSIDYTSWLRDSRFDAVRWILNTQTRLRYRNQTAYLSVSYLDRFISIRHIDENKLWAVRLLSVACLSLAAKMEESKVAALSEYPVLDFRFDSHAIQKMELLVLSTMNWKMGLVTPFAYLHFFAKDVGDQKIVLGNLLSKAVELVMALMQENRLIEYRPSVIALAAVLAASDWQMTQETLKIKVNSVSVWETSDTLQQEKQLLSCYNIMQRLSTKGNTSTPSLPQVQHTSDETPFIVGTKRKLTFTDSDENPKLPDKSRRD
ncbi:cyclin-D5-1-like isoform X1 [Silene latifolia]|uniref:cyclin-D5-1-like isoform X1 n=1 Tax=Silene latifolia TaxID=37657 RepID=UPI003D78A4FC